MKRNSDQLTLDLDMQQINALHDLISRETQNYTQDPKSTPERIRELRFIEQVLANYL